VTTLDQVPVGAVWAWAARVTANDPITGIDMTFFTRDRTPAGSIHLDAGGAVTGAVVLPFNQIQVTVVSQTFNVGDVVVSNATG